MDIAARHDHADRPNLGWGNTLYFAGFAAIDKAFGEGSHSTRASYADRWKHFTAWAESQGILDAREITLATLTAYGEQLSRQVQAGRMKVRHAQNLLSAAGVVLSLIRGDDHIKVSPSQIVGRRTGFRTTPPSGLDREQVAKAAEGLRRRGYARLASAIELARHLGLQRKEILEFDCKAAFEQATQQGSVEITSKLPSPNKAGKTADRWVPADEHALGALSRAAALQGQGTSLKPATMDANAWSETLKRMWVPIKAYSQIENMSDLRAAYACQRYEQITGFSAPAVSGRREAPKEKDKAARNLLCQELGLAKIDGMAIYVGRIGS